MDLSFPTRSFLVALMLALPVLADQAPASFDVRWEIAQAKKPARSSAKSAPVVKAADEGDWWFRAYSGLDISFLEHIAEGTKNLKELIDEIGFYGEQAGSNMGVLFGVELGTGLRKGDGLSLSLEGVLSSTHSLVAIVPGSAFSFRFEPSLYSASLNYHHAIASDRDHRTVLTFGAGYYMAFVNYAGVAIPAPFMVEAELTGSAPGAILGITQEWKVDELLSLEASARFRWADITRLEASRAKIDGSVTDTDVALANAEFTPGKGIPILIDQATIDADPTLGYAHADFSGFDLGLNLKLVL